MSYDWRGDRSKTISALAPTTDSTCISVTTIPKNGDTPLEVSMYMYFKGEDANCKSSNAAGIALNDITITAKFKTFDT